VYLNRLPSSAGVDPSSVALGTRPDALSLPGSAGVTLELCAGIVDKPGKSLAEIAREEVLEECGYDVQPERLERVKSFVSSVGVAGSRMTLFCLSVTDADRVNAGGGNPSEGERIQVVELTVDQLREYLGRDDILSPPGFLFGLYWFFAHKLKQPL